MKRYRVNREFFGVLINDKKNKINMSCDKLVGDLLLLLNGEESIDAFLKKHEAETDLKDILEIITDMINDEYLVREYEISSNKARQGKLSAPLRVFYDISYQCNLRCKHCFTQSGKKDANELSLEEKYKLIDDLAKMNVNRISIAGGEPLVSPDFIPFIRKCKEKGILVSFTTNGILLDEKIIKELVENSIKTITVSIDGYDKDSIEKVRGKGTYQKILDGLEKLKLYYPDNYAVKTTMMKTNIDRVEDIIKLAIEYKCKTIKFNCVRPDGNANLNSQLVLLSQDEYINTVKKIESLKQVYTSINIKGPLNIFCDEPYDFIPELGFGCFAGKESIYINPLGEVKPCGHFSKDFICGNVKYQSLEEIWDSSLVLKKFRENYGNDVCSNCNVYNKCRSGCRYRAFLDGNLKGIDPFCFLYKNLGDKLMLKGDEDR